MGILPLTPGRSDLKEFLRELINQNV